MNEHPILFSTPMVRAILLGRKTQTRRVVKEPVLDLLKQGLTLKDDYENGNTGEIIPIKQLCPYGQPGDRLWVRETWAPGMNVPQPAIYKASWPSFPDVADIRWHPSIHMPRRFSRITLEITDVRVQRLQDISEEDAKAEGTTLLKNISPGQKIPGMPGATFESHPYRAAFAILWDSINAARGYGWDTNPWVWAVSFKRVEPPCK